ncbi:MAG TPA: selenide, water dikinase SelD, partial [Bacteroidetes bacterium]|nr:selenide, water dikinase SelD [Bacteroidota bacterium]
RNLEKNGFRLTVLPVDEAGVVDLSALEEAIDEETILVSVMHANNEVGTIQPIREIAEIAHVHGALLHVDAAQSVGKIPVRVDELGVDLLSVAGHKFYAPKGVGALYVRRGVRLEKLIHGASHELNRRAGTENVLEIVGLGKAAELVLEELEAEMPRLQRLRDRLWEHLSAELADIRLNGHPTQRLPNTLSVGFRGLEANTILSELDSVAASAGAACHADEVSVSHVLEAMRVPLEYAMGTIRFSVGRMTTEEEIDRAAQAVVETVKRLQAEGEPLFVAAGSPDVRLTHFTHGLGCACKLRPQVLEEVLAQMPATGDPRVLVGTETADDAAVYKLDERTALVQTVDFFTPVVDDPYQFGAIAAANSLSDVYAMGGRPLFALNVVGFPSNRLPTSVLERILEGARDKTAEAGISIVGGHTVDDTEPKFGLAVTGVVDPNRILTNSGAQVGDGLVLTKAIGTGVLATALKRGLLDRDVEERLITTMASLNRVAAETAQGYNIHACTDVTGFGLLGHLYEMARASGVNVEVEANAVPLLPGAAELAAAG